MSSGESSRYVVDKYVDFALEKPSYMVLGIPDTGLIGVISTAHLIKKLSLREVAGVDSSVFPPVAIVSGGKIRPPMRIFHGGNLMVVHTEVLPDVRFIGDLISFIGDLAKSYGVDYIVSMTGIPASNRLELKDLKSYVISTSEELNSRLAGYGLTLFSNGYLIGPNALLMKEASRRGINAIAILTESFAEFPDPEASARSIEVLSRIIDRNIDVKELIEEGELIRLRTKEHMRRVLKDMASMKKGLEHTPPIYT